MFENFKKKNKEKKEILDMILRIIDEFSKLQKKIKEYENSKKEMTLQNVRDIIDIIKLNYENSILIEDKINNSNLDKRTKNKLLTKLVSKFENIKLMYEMVLNYEKQLKELENINK